MSKALLLLTVDAWIESEGKQAAFGARDSKGNNWTIVIPLPAWAGLTCRRCGKAVRYGWRRGLSGKTAYCRECVILDDSHKNTS